LNWRSIFERDGFLFHLDHSTAPKKKPPVGDWELCVVRGDDDSSKQAHQLFNLPNMIGKTSGHSWRDPQRLVNPAEVVVNKVQGNRVLVVLDFLAEPQRKPGW
jgi:hypothetical protein